MNPLRFVSILILLVSSAAVGIGQNINLDAALRQAAQDGDMHSVKELAAKGANVNAQDENGQTALLWVAPARDNPEMVKFLISRGTDVNAKDKHGNTALMIAASQSNPGILSALIAAGARVNEQNEDGQTALMAAAFRANLDELKILLANKADQKLRDKQGRLAFDVARDGSGNYTDEENAKRFAEALNLLAAPSVAAQTKPDFSGRWTSEPETSTAAQGSGQGSGGANQPSAARAGDFGSGWGSNLTITRTAGQLTVECPVFSRYDMQPPLKFVYALDGAETKNSVMMGRGIQTQTSTTAWDGDRLVITTAHTFENPTDGLPSKIDVKQKLWLESPTSLVVETTKGGGVLGGPLATTRTVYRKLTVRAGGT